MTAPQGSLGDVGVHTQLLKASLQRDGHKPARRVGQCSAAAESSPARQPSPAREQRLSASLPAAGLGSLSASPSPGSLPARQQSARHSQGCGKMTRQRVRPLWDKCAISPQEHASLPCKAGRAPGNALKSPWVWVGQHLALLMLPHPKKTPLQGAHPLLQHHPDTQTWAERPWKALPHLSAFTENGPGAAGEPQPQPVLPVRQQQDNFPSVGSLGDL